MTSSGRPKLGDVFRGENPERIEGLAGLLPAGPVVRPVPVRPVALPPLPEGDEPPAVSDATPDDKSASIKSDRGSGAVENPPQPDGDSAAASETAATAASQAPARKLRNAAPGQKAATAARPRWEEIPPQVRDTTVKMVPANIDVSVHQELRRFAVRTELSFATIALRAIEANAVELAQLWRTPPAEPVRTGLFGSVQERPGNRRAEPAAQVQLRLQASDAAVLDGLVADWAAPSRSALVNEALKRYLPATDDAPAT